MTTNKPCSLQTQELDSDNKIFNTQPNRINRIARGAGVSVRHVHEVLETFKPFKKVASKMKQLGPKGASLECFVACSP